MTHFVKPFPSSLTTIQQCGNNLSSNSKSLTYSNFEFAILKNSRTCTFFPRKCLAVSASIPSFHTFILLFHIIQCKINIFLRIGSLMIMHVERAVPRWQYQAAACRTRCMPSELDCSQRRALNIRILHKFFHRCSF